MPHKIIILAAVFLFLSAAPALADVKMEWDTTAGWSDGDSDWTWDTGLTGSGNWSLGSNFALFLKGQFDLSQAEHQGKVEMDRFYLQYEQGPYRINLGRQGVAWGIGWFFRPTDLITPLTPLAEEETRPGKDLAVMRWSTSPLTATDFIAGEHRYAARSEWRIGPTNLRVLGLYQPGYINMVGFDVQGGLAGFYGEGAYRWADTETVGRGRYEGIIGWQKVIGSGDQLYFEYFRNDLSKADPVLADLLKQNRNREFIYTNQNYLAVGLKIPWDQLTTYSVTTVSNMDDGGAILTGIASWQISDNLDIRATLMTVMGSDDTEFYRMDQGARVAAVVELKCYF